MNTISIDNNYYFKIIDNIDNELNIITNIDVRIDIWTHFMRECIIDYVH